MVLRQRLSRALTGLCASGLAAASLVVVGVSVAPAADAAAAPPSTPWTWGENAYGQLGNGTTTTRRSGAPVNGLSGVVDLHGGREHVVALKSDGTVWTWGSNAEGQQGRGTTANTLTPTQVTSLGSDNVAVETGHNHTVVLKSNGTIWTFGLNTDGQLGDGTTTLRRSPVQVRGIDDAVGIAAGRDMSFAIRPGGQLWAWGRNDEGQLGDGTTTRRLTPVRTGGTGFADVKTLTGGRDHGVAVKDDGSVWAWGSNNYGQVGDGTLVDKLSPQPIDINGAAAGLGTASEAAAGAHHSYALRTDGTVASWGRNYRTELGDGTTTNRTRAVTVLDASGNGTSPLSNAVSIGSGRDMGNVTLSDGRVKAWGHNLYGQLGDGSTTNRTRAIVVPGVSNAVKAGGGGSAYGVVLVADGTPPQNQPPTARISGTDCTDLSCPLNGTTSSDDNGIVSYEWDFGDTTTGTGVSPGHTYSGGGTYTVTLTVTDAQGLEDSDTATVSPTDPGPPVDDPPTARISGTTCSALSCPLSGDTSSDDNGIVSYEWDFGDTTTGTGVSPGHTYASAGSYLVTLTVTDAAGQEDVATATVTPSDAPPAPAPSFRAAAATMSNTTSATVTVPTTVVAGDQLVLVVTGNTSATHTGPAGWTLRGSTTDGTELRSSVYTRTAVDAIRGTAVRVGLSTTTKVNLSLLAYADAAPVTVLASAVQGTASVTAHPAPAAPVATAGSAVLRYWVDKSSSTRTWTTPGGVTRRTTSNGTGGGSLSAITADTLGVPSGTVAAVSATASLASNKAIGWTVVVPHG